MQHLPFLRFAVAGAALCTFTLANAASTLVVSGDEWPLTNDAYARQSADVTRLVSNMAGMFGGTNYLIVSNGAANVSGLANLSLLQTELAGLGKTVTTSSSYSTALLAGQDAVLLFGYAQGANDATNLAAFVNGGGNLLVSLGTGGLGSAPAEAAAWNPLLNQFGLNAGSVWLPVAAFYDAPVMQGATPLDDGLATVVWGYGQTITELNAANANTDLLLADFGANYGTQGAFGIYSQAGVVPEPGTYALMLAGLAGMAAVARRRRA